MHSSLDTTADEARPRVAEAAARRDRRLVLSWDDPMAGSRLAHEMRGIDFLRAWLRGEIPPPPIGTLMGISLDLVEEGRVVFSVTPGEQHYNPIGMVHGGLVATLLDSAMGSAVQSTLDAGVGHTTLELSVNFVAAVTRDTGPLLGEGRVLHRGGRTATAEGRVTAVSNGRLIAHGTTTCLLTRPEKTAAHEPS
jgi:uncharacterized protein (TIGR00369 family)